MIIEFRVRNYKSIQDSDYIPLKPLTILTGPNSSGKSNLLESILILPQIARRPTDYRHLSTVLVDGEFYKYPRSPFDFVAYKQDTSKSISFDITIEPILDELNQIESLEKIRKATSMRAIGYGVSYNPKSQELVQEVFLDREVLVATRYALEGNTWRQSFVFPKELANRRCGEASKPLNRRAFALDSISDELLRDPAIGQSGYNQLHDKTEIAGSIIDVIEKCLQRVFLISMPRGIVDSSIKASGEFSWVGKGGENIVQILSLIFASRKYDAKADRIVHWTERFGLGKIKAGYKGGENLASDFYDNILEKDFNLALASYGSRQLLSVITQIFWSDPGDVIVIEEPEISLHPESQVMLQELFAEAVRDGKQIIYTTHSPFLVLSVSKVVRQSQLAVDDIVIHHVEKTREGTKTKQLELDKYGFVKGWIPSYLKVEDELFREWAEKLE